MSESKIKRNVIRCNSCGDTIESRQVHDAVWCGCGKVMTDGGIEYLRRRGLPGSYTNLTEYET